MGVEPKIVGFYPKMDGLFHGKPYEQMMIWGVKTTIFGNIQYEPLLTARPSGDAVATSWGLPWHLHRRDEWA